MIHASINAGLLMGLATVVVFPSMVDVGCFSHTLDLVGDKFSTPCLSSFMDWWISLFSHSPKSMLLWKERTGQSHQGYILCNSMVEYVRGDEAANGVIC